MESVYDNLVDNLNEAVQYSRDIVSDFKSGRMSLRTAVSTSAIIIVSSAVTRIFMHSRKWNTRHSGNSLTSF